MKSMVLDGSMTLGFLLEDERFAGASCQNLPVITDDQQAPACAKAALALTRQYELTVYDASYLEPALRRGSPLATADRSLARAARAAGVTVLGSSE